MAIQTKTVTLAAVTSGTFVFTKPVGNYTKDACDRGDFVDAYFAADTDNGDGTMTGTLNLSDTFTGTVAVVIIDLP